MTTVVQYTRGLFSRETIFLCTVPATTFFVDQHGDDAVRRTHPVNFSPPMLLSRLRTTESVPLVTRLIYILSVISPPRVAQRSALYHRGYTVYHHTPSLCVKPGVRYFFRGIEKGYHWEVIYTDSQILLRYGKKLLMVNCCS